MQKYVKNYLTHFDLGEQDICQCEACGKQGRLDGDGFDIHHIHGRISDEVNNLILLCRKCHERAHGGIHPLSKGEFQYIHNKFLLGNRKPLLK